MSTRGETAERAIALCRVTKRYGRSVVLRDLCLSVSAGSVVGLIGANGAGKTTLLRIAVGLVPIDSGDVRIHGRSVRGGPSESVAYYAGEHTLPDRSRAHSWARVFGVRQDQRERLGKLSRGVRQRVGLATALGRSDSTIIVLDEPWVSLDTDASEWFAAAVRRRRRDGAAVLLASHRFADLAEVCDLFAVLHDGRLTIVGATEVKVSLKRTRADFSGASVNPTGATRHDRSPLGRGSDPSRRAGESGGCAGPSAALSN